MAEAMYVGVHDEERVVVPSGGYNAGDIVLAPSGRAGVVQGQRPLEEDELATLATRGKFSVDAASGTTFTAGVTVEWDDTGKLAVADAAGDFDIGIASKAKISGETKVEILFNE